MSVDCSIFTMSLGFSDPDPFARFVPGWYAAIAAMDPLPAEVCIAYPYGDASGVDQPPASFPVPIRFVRVADTEPNDLMSAAVNHAGTKWVSWCGLDDRVLPDALVDLPAADSAGADFMPGWYLADGRRVGGWDVRAMAVGGINDTAANSPFTKAIFQRVGGWPPIYFSDWGLWLLFAKAGVSLYRTDRVGMVQDLGHDHPTRSGVQLPGEVRRMAMDEIAALVRELWPEGYQ